MSAANINTPTATAATSTAPSTARQKTSQLQQQQQHAEQKSNAMYLNNNMMTVATALPSLNTIHQSTPIPVQHVPGQQFIAVQSSVDSMYSYDNDYIDKLRLEKPWDSKVTYFHECKISTYAVMKMLKHALLGVDRGRQANGVPQEIMGLMIGKPDGNSIVITDVAPLPVTGTETRVVADGR
jgi:hypothetical protein